MRVNRVLFAAALALFAALSASPAVAWRGEVGWTFRADDGISSGVAVAGNLVIAGDRLGKLYAVQKASGVPAWVYTGTNTVVGTPSVMGDKVIFAQGNGAVTCLALSTGAVVWQYLPPEEGYAAETLADGTAVGDGKVYLAKGDGKLYAISASNGRLVWTHTADQELRNAPAFEAGLVLLGEQNGRFSAIDPKTGKRIWGGGAGGAINTPVMSGGSVFYSSWDGTVQRVRVKGVIPLWKDSKPNVGEPVTTPPTVGGGRVFVGTANGKIVALSEENGAILWQFETNGGNVAARPVLAEGLVFAGGGDGVLHVLDASSGAERATLTTGEGINGTPAFDGGVLYLGSGDGTLCAIY